MKCPDCKDGFYYPLIGSRETCQTCGNNAPSEHEGHFLEPIYGAKTIAAAKAQEVLNEQAMISEPTHPASVHPDPQDADKARQAKKDHYYAGQAASMVETQAEKDAIWAKAKISESTDLSMWFQNLGEFRRRNLIEFFSENPVNVFNGSIFTYMNKAIIGRFFRVTSVTDIANFFRSHNREIYLSDFAAFLNEQDERWQKEDKDISYSYSRQTLKDNGFNPKEL